MISATKEVFNSFDVVLAPKVVKIADFGIARFQSQGGAMTRETGTYRWMAPEVCAPCTCQSFLRKKGFSGCVTHKRKGYALKITSQTMNLGSTSSFVCNLSRSNVIAI